MDMGTVEVERFDLEAAASGLAPVMEYGRGRAVPSFDARTRFAQRTAILEKHEMTAIIPKAISLSTGQ
jgi:hypothetical protein